MGVKQTNDVHVSIGYQKKMVTFKLRKFKAMHFFNCYFRENYMLNLYMATFKTIKGLRYLLRLLF